jgi:hypothetical protein
VARGASANRPRRTNGITENEWSTGPQRTRSVADCDMDNSHAPEERHRPRKAPPIGDFLTP